MANWAAAFKGLGQGMDDLRDAKEQTLEMEYKTMRDNNLRRYQVEDRDLADTREDTQRKEDRDWKEQDVTTAQQSKDDESGVSETPRGEKYSKQQEKVQERALARIAKSNEGRSLYGRANKMSKEAFIDRGMQLIQAAHQATSDPDVMGSSTMKDSVYDYYLKSLANEWEQRQVRLGNKEEGDYTPYKTNDPDDLGSSLRRDVEGMD